MPACLILGENASHLDLSLDIFAKYYENNMQDIIFLLMSLSIYVTVSTFYLKNLTGPAIMLLKGNSKGTYQAQALGLGTPVGARAKPCHS